MLLTHPLRLLSLALLANAATHSASPTPTTQPPLPATTTSPASTTPSSPTPTYHLTPHAFHAPSCAAPPSASSSSPNNIFAPLIDLLRKRQSSPCASGYASCADSAGAQGLCCPTTAVCSADAMGNIGCCPTGAACTGTVSSSASSSNTGSGGTTTTTTSGSGGNSGIVIGAGGQTVSAGLLGTNNQQTTSTTNTITGPAVLTGSNGQVTATVSQSGFDSGETVFAAGAERVELKGVVGVGMGLGLVWGAWEWWRVDGL